MNPTFLQRFTCCTVNVARLLLIAIVLGIIIASITAAVMRSKKEEQPQLYDGNQNAITNHGQGIDTLLQSEGKLEELKAQLHHDDKLRSKMISQEYNARMQGIMEALANDGKLEEARSAMMKQLGDSQKMMQFQKKLMHKGNADKIQELLQNGNVETAAASMHDFMMKTMKDLV